MECIVLPIVSLIVLFVNGDRADIVAQVCALGAFLLISNCFFASKVRLARSN